ncbi:MAG: hypothetical protein KIT80_04780 [Chitinophagaceae bacterium]|nr:hypothetical protein [Chitinophagaceae bacterium]MCW5926207.1 hypothetical protein [Chitinophagaceae bacterium]
MSKNIPSVELKERIAALEKEAREIEADMKNRFDELSENLKPVNAIKSIFKQVGSSPETKGDILNTVVSLGMGYLGNKLLWSGTGGVVKRVAGAALQMGAGTNVVKKAGVWTRFAKSLFTKETDDEIKPVQPAAPTKLLLES